MRHYDRHQFRHLDDAERYRDYEYIADEPWTGPNERDFGGPARALRKGPRADAHELAEEHHRERGDGERRSQRPPPARPTSRQGSSPSLAAVSRVVALLSRSSNALVRQVQSLFMRRRAHRSDRSILEEVREKLASSAEFDARRVDVTVRNGDVILEGHVADQRARHAAEDLLEDVPGVVDVMNRLHVRRRPT